MADSDNVVALRNTVVTGSERKAQFLDYLGAMFDEYVQDFGEEPECIVFVLNGVGQKSAPYWLTNGASSGCASSVMALAQTTILKQVMSN